MRPVTLEPNTANYYLWRMYFIDGLGVNNGLASMVGENNLRRVLDNHDKKGGFTITLDEYCGKASGEEQSGKIVNLIYRHPISYEEVSIGFSEFLAAGKPEVIRMTEQFSPLEEKSKHVAL